MQRNSLITIFSSHGAFLVSKLAEDNDLYSSALRIIFHQVTYCFNLHCTVCPAAMGMTVSSPNG